MFPPSLFMSCWDCESCSESSALRRLEEAVKVLNLTLALTEDSSYFYLIPNPFDKVKHDIRLLTNRLCCFHWRREVTRLPSALVSYSSVRRPLHYFPTSTISHREETLVTTVNHIRYKCKWRVYLQYTSPKFIHLGIHSHWLFYCRLCYFQHRFRVWQHCIYLIR